MHKLIRHFLFGVFLFPALASAADITLVGMVKQEELASTRILLELSGLPLYRVQSSGQRVDLFLAETEPSTTISRLPADDTVVEVLLARHHKGMMVSFLLRRPPVRTMATVYRNPDRITLDLFWDKAEARPAIAFRVPGLPSRSGDGATAASRPGSAYAGRWESFFAEYQTPFQLPVSLRYSLGTLPPAPLRQPGGGELGKALDRLVESGDWAELQSTLSFLAEKGFPEGDGGGGMRVLWAEALMRIGQSEKALVVLSKIGAEELSSPLQQRVTFLKSFSLAASGDPYSARLLLRETAEAMSKESLYRPFAVLLQAEIALGLGEYAAALKLLEQADIIWPESLSSVGRLRRADALAGVERGREALDVYRPLVGFGEILAQRPFSLRQAAEAFMAEADYRQATILYEQLAKEDGLTRAARGMALLGAGLASEAAGDRRRAHMLPQVWADYAEDEAGLRARMKLIDKAVLTGGELERRRAAIDYGQISRIAPLRELREEAAFKQGLALFLGNEQSAVVQSLGSFLRDFSSGSLVEEARMLMREALPPVIDALIEKGEDLKALVLVEQYRDLLVSGPMSWSFLIDVARASSRLGLFERACKVYLYMLDAASGTPEEETFYLPFLELAFERGQFPQVGNYALRYLTRFPSGEDRSRIYYLRVRALQEEGRLEAATDLLKLSQRPEDQALEMLAAEIFWEAGSYGDVADCFEASGQEALPVPPGGLILKAEALFRMGRTAEALPLFQELAGHEIFGDQATSRCAEIHLAEGRKEQGLKLLRGLAEEGKDPLWRRLAQQTLADAIL